MPLLQQLENILDRLVPVVEAVGSSTMTYSVDEFQVAINALIARDGIVTRTETDTFYDLRVTGFLVGELSHAKVLLGKPAKPEMYKNIRFRLQVTLLDDGHVTVRAFEHIIGLPMERRAVQILYSERVASTLELLDNIRQSNATA